MVSKAFFTGSKYLVEDNDGRQDYLRYDGERFLSALATAGQRVLRAPLDADEQSSSSRPTRSYDADERSSSSSATRSHDADERSSSSPATRSHDAADRKSAYLKALVRLNRNYFEAREYEADAEGKYYKHDERAERRFRIETAEQFSDAVDDLRALLSAHDALLEDVAERIERQRGDRRKQLAAIRSTLLACTDGAVSEGWFPTVEAYYYSLSPGELVAEDRERRKQRIEGTESSRGIAELLSKPHFQKLTGRDLRRIRELNRESPGSDARVWKRLNDDYRWFLTCDRTKAASGSDSSSDEPSDDE